MQILYDRGSPILFIYGGEPFLWRDHNRTFRDLVIIAKDIDFAINRTIIVYMAVNRLNRDVICQVGDLTLDYQNIIGGSFNFYNPYPGTSARSWNTEKSGIVAAASMNLGFAGNAATCSLMSAAWHLTAILKSLST